MSRVRRSYLSARPMELREAPTFREAALWEELRSAKLGVTFRRQVPLRGYIVDFYASKAKLIVEVDGGCHAERVAKDAARDAVLVAAGYRVVRVSEEVVVKRREEAVARVRRALAG